MYLFTSVSCVSILKTCLIHVFSTCVLLCFVIACHGSGVVMILSCVYIYIYGQIIYIYICIF